MPTSHQASAQPLTSSRITSGRASVVRSRSGAGRPSRMSRTEPPTSARLCPRWNRRPARRAAARAASAPPRAAAVPRAGRAARRLQGRRARAGRVRRYAAARARRGLPGPPSAAGYDREMPRSPHPVGPARRRPAQRGLRKVEETSAGGLVVDRTGGRPRVAIIGRVDRRGRLLWSLPKGHVEAGRDRRGRRGPRGRGGDRHPRPGARRARHHRLLVRRREPADPQDGAPLPARPPVASSPTRTSRSTRWPGCRWTSCASGSRTPASGGWPRRRPVCSRTRREPPTGPVARGASAALAAAARHPGRRALPAGAVPGRPAASRLATSAAT